MKPTCANSTSANATETLRNATSRSACIRIREADGASAAAFAIAAVSRPGGWPTNTSTIGTSVTSITTATAVSAPENPNVLMAATSTGTPAMPPKLAPFSARLIAMPRLRSNQSPSVLVMTPRLVPAQPNASTASATNNCHGEVAWPISTAAVASAQMPASRQLRGPKPRIASLMKVTSSAPNR